MPSVPCSSSTLPPSSNSYVRIMHRIFLVLFILNFDSVPHVLAANAPIIGARCELGSEDVQIGGKQTQFFLRCEQTERSGQGYGEWVVKSRMASSAPSQPAVQAQPQVTIVSSQAHEPKQQYSRYPASTTYSQPIICAQDLNSREGEQCTAPMTCLQQNPTDPSTFLQCDPNSHRWTKKSCTEGMQFVFEKQTCTANSKQNFHRYMSRQFAAGVPGGAGGLVCMYMQCSNMNPCPQGSTCNNGYCCSPAGSNSALPQMSPPNFAASNLAAFPPNPMIACPGGVQPFGRCINGYCGSGYECMPRLSICCPQVPQIPTIPTPTIPNTCPVGGAPVGNCINGMCPTGFVCNPMSNQCCPTSGSTGSAGAISTAPNPFVCPDGTQAAGACINGQCGGGFSCAGGICCNVTSHNPRCLDGSQAVGACIRGQCGGGFVCTTGNVCCPSNSGTQEASSSACPNGGHSVGVCVNNMCPVGFSCLNNHCCPSDGTTTGVCHNRTLAIGSCGTGHTCPDGGFSCDVSLNLCCPRITPLGQCVGNLCPTGHVCYPNSTAPNAMCYQSCGGTGTPVGGSINGLCPAGSILTFGECCRRNSYREAFFGTPLYDYTPSVMKANVLGTCMNGSPIISGCIKGVCGAGLDCINDVCCASNSNSQNAIAFSPQSTRPIGVKCEMPQQCVGFNEGLSTCDMGRCKCQPYAYTQGMACVRRKSFSMKFKDALPIDDTISAPNSVIKSPEREVPKA